MTISLNDRLNYAANISGVTIVNVYSDGPVVTARWIEGKPFIEQCQRFTSSLVSRCTAMALIAYSLGAIPKNKAINFYEDTTDLPSKIMDKINIHLMDVLLPRKEFNRQFNLLVSKKSKNLMSILASRFRVSESDVIQRLKD